MQLPQGVDRPIDEGASPDVADVLVPVDRADGDGVGVVGVEVDEVLGHRIGDLLLRQVDGGRRSDDSRDLLVELVDRGLLGLVTALERGDPLVLLLVERVVGIDTLLERGDALLKRCDLLGLPDLLDDVRLHPLVSGGERRCQVERRGQDDGEDDHHDARSGDRATLEPPSHDGEQAEDDEEDPVDPPVTVGHAVPDGVHPEDDGVRQDDKGKPSPFLLPQHHGQHDRDGADDPSWDQHQRFLSVVVVVNCGRRGGRSRAC